jgi:hypothetical protein
MAIFWRGSGQLTEYLYDIATTHAKLSPLVDLHLKHPINGIQHLKTLQAYRKPLVLSASNFDFCAHESARTTKQYHRILRLESHLQCTYTSYHLTPSITPMSDTAEGSRPAAPAEGVIGSIATPTSIARLSHESSLIAQPSTFLSPAQNRAMQDKPLTSVDRDQQSGLVSRPRIARCVVARASRIL